MFLIFGIAQDIIQVYQYEPIKFFSKDFVDLAFETGQNIGQSKEYNLILIKIVPSAKGCFLFITFLNPHIMVSTDQV